MWMSVLVSVILSGQNDQAWDPYGGWKELTFPKTGFFRTHFDGERWWLVTPEGHAFLSIGVCHTTPYGDYIRGTNRQPYRESVLAKYSNDETWARATRDRLKTWGFNTLGAWSGREIRSMPRTAIMSFASGAGGRQVGGGMPDFFDPNFAAHADRVAQACKGQREDPWLIGYFLDNELSWDTDWRPVPNLFDRYATLPGSAAGKQVWCELLRKRHGMCEAFNRVWSPAIASWKDLEAVRKLTPRPGQASQAAADRRAFMGAAADQYFRVSTQAIRRHDPNHLILGCRFVSWVVPQEVARACGENCDVVSLNFYELGAVGWLVHRHRQAEADWVPGQPDFTAFARLTKKPLMITEFSFRSVDSGMPNTYPPGLAVQPRVPTQKARADRYTRYVQLWMSQPFFVGYHWFEWADEPAEGRFDGENGNYGLVNIRDEPYDVFVKVAKAVNQGVWSLHRVGDEKR